MIKIVKYFFKSFFIYLFFLIAKILGLKLSRKLFSTIFRIAGPLIRSNRIIDKNLDIFSKNISTDNTNKIKKEMWENYGKTFIEYIFLKKLRNSQTDIVIEGKEILDKIFNNNKPVIFFSGHFANFELMSMEITKKNIKLATIYRPLNNWFLNPLMENIRRKYICKNQIKKGRSSMRNLLTLFKNGNSIALMIDQRVSEGLKSNFFGEKAYTTTIPAQFAKKFKCKIVPISIVREKEIYFKMTVFKPLEFEEYDSEEKITQDLNIWLAETINKSQTNWIWSHDRWK